MKGIIEYFTHLLELFGRVELNVELCQQLHELIEGNFRFWMGSYHLLDNIAEFLIICLYYFASEWL